MNFFLFPGLFEALETQGDDTSSAASGMGIQSYGIAMTTLEEVFLKLGEEEDEDEDKEGKEEKGKQKKENKQGTCH